MIKLPTIARDAIALNMIAEELLKARVVHAPLNSAHEAYEIILEELDEFWDEVNKKSQLRNHTAMAKKLVQVAAMAVRACSDLELLKDQHTS